MTEFCEIRVTYKKDGGILRGFVLPSQLSQLQYALKNNGTLVFRNYDNNGTMLIPASEVNLVVVFDGPPLPRPSES